MHILQHTIPVKRRHPTKHQQTKKQEAGSTDEFPHYFQQDQQ